MKRHLHLPPNNKDIPSAFKTSNPKPETEVQSWIQISIQVAGISI